MSSSMMQRFPVFEGLFCPTLGGRASSVELSHLKRAEVIDCK
jgi:hypothetical protein